MNYIGKFDILPLFYFGPKKIGHAKNAFVLKLTENG